MLVQLVSLLHHLVKGDLVGRVDDRLPADRAGVVVVGPVEQALDVEDVLGVAG